MKVTELPPQISLNALEAVEVCLEIVGRDSYAKSTEFARALSTLETSVFLATDELFSLVVDRTVHAHQTTPRADRMALSKVCATLTSVATDSSSRGWVSGVNWQRALIVQALVGSLEDPLPVRWGCQFGCAPSGGSAQAAPGQVTRSPDQVCVWRSLVQAGELGYRYHGHTIGPGCLSVDLFGAVTAAERTELVRIVFQDGAVDRTGPLARDLLSKAPRDSARILVQHVVDYREPGVGINRSDGETLALLELAAFQGVDSTTESGWMGPLFERARQLSDGDSIPNPVLAVADEARNLSSNQFVDRPSVLAQLIRALEDSREPLAIYCMRKSGKTATALSLGRTMRYPTVYVNVGPPNSAGPEGADEVIARLEGSLDAQQGSPLLVLDEFDTFCRRLGKLSQDGSGRFLSWLEGRARLHKVLCLGLDPTALPSVHPETNPLQNLHQFRLPYFDLADATRLVGVLTSHIGATPTAIQRAWSLSGGHPVVMKRLLLVALIDTLGYPSDIRRVPRGCSIEFSDQLWSAIQSPSGGSSRLTCREGTRQYVLERVIETSRSEVPSIRDAWAVLRGLAQIEAETIEFDKALEVCESTLLAVGRMPGRPPREMLEQLWYWGLLGMLDDGRRLSFGIPLVRAELTKGMWNYPCSN